MTHRIAVVTGSQRGIGLAIVRALCRRLGNRGVVYLTAHEEGHGEDAVNQLKKEGLQPRYYTLDVTDEGNIKRLRDHISDEHGGIDIVVNNAGVAYLDKDNLPMSVQAEGSVKVNFFGTLNMTNTFLPLMRDGGRIVNISSRAAVPALYRLREDLQNRFREASSEQEVVDLMNEFVNAMRRDPGGKTEHGWPAWAYGTSKLGVVGLTRVHGREMTTNGSGRDILINCCYPGYVATSMTAHHTGEKTKLMITPDEGAETPVYLALLAPSTTGIQGEFVARKTVYDFFHNEVDPAIL